MMKPEKGTREELPFFIIVVVVLIFLYGIALYSNADLRVMPAVLVFTLLMAVHTLLHWFIIRFVKTLTLALLYLIIQLTIASIIIYVTRDPTLVFGLYMALLGEVVGVFRGRMQKIISISVVLLLTVIAALFVIRDADLPLGLLVGIGPGALFVVIYVNLYSRQVEAREKAQFLLEELEDAHGKLADYAARVKSLTITAERARLARELHDTLAQGLSGLILQLEAAEAHLTGGNNQRTGQIIQDAMEKARATLSDARRAIDDLRGEDRDSTALEAAVIQEAERFSEATGILCTCSFQLRKPVPETVADHIKKIITEGLTNIAKHSGAGNCYLTVAEKGGNIELKIEDDGKGFDPNQIPEGHYGLLGIRERSRLLRGEMTVSSVKGGGTTITVAIPEDEYS